MSEDEVEQPPPTSGVELAQRIGAALDEGVVVALFPDVLESVTHTEAGCLDKKGTPFTLVLADCGPWGIRLIDIYSENEENVKWWRVKEAASAEQVDYIPVRWEGPIGEIPERYFRPDAVLGIRFWAHSPWWFPLEKPITRKEVVASDKREDSTTDEGAGSGTGAADADRGTDTAEGGSEGCGEPADQLPT